jgi:hypothetical protein
MKRYQNTIFGLRHKGWTHSEVIAYFVRGVTRKLHIVSSIPFESLLTTRKKCKEKRWEKTKINNAMYLCNLDSTTTSLQIKFN